MTSHSDNICHLLHYTRNHILALWPQATIFMTSHPLYCASYPVYLCHQTQGINYTTPALCMISHTLYMRKHIKYTCNHNNCLWHHTPLCITSHPLYLWHHIQYVCYHHTAFMTKQQLYLTCHPPYLTSQPLYLCHHTYGTHICIYVSLYPWYHKCVTHHNWHMYDIILILHHITFTLYDINDHVLWHHKHCIHDIRSPLYDITSTL